MRRLRFFFAFVLPVFCIAAITIRAHGQVANNTSLVGTITDPSGSVISGATVTATDEATKISYPGTTNAQGYYSIQFIQPGTYDITVTQNGFTKMTKTGLVVTIDRAVRTDFSLKVGSTATSVTVSGSAPAIHTDDASLGETFNTKTVSDLPLLGHNALEVAATASNVTIGPSSGYSGVPPGDDFVGAGQREIQSSMTLDGVSIMNNLITLAPARPSADMISEVQMQSGNYPAQYGSYLGVHVNLVSKSGTNNLHGAVYDYIQNTALNAHQFTDPVGAPKQIQHYNQYGFDVGGPVYIPRLYNGRDKTFFFGSWERLNQIQQSSSIVSVLTPAEEAGNFSQYPVQIYDPTTGLPYKGNQIPMAELNTPAALISKKLEAYMVAPTSPGITNNLLNYYPNNLKITQSLDRVDENIGQNIRLFGRYHWQDITVVSGSNFPSSNSYGPTNTRNYAFGYTQIITPNLINDFRIGLNTVISNSLDYFEVNGPKDAGTALGIPGFNSDTLYDNPGLPTINIDQYNGLGNSSANWYQDDRTLDAYDELSYTRGRHNFMAGAEIRRLALGREAANDARGVFNFQPGGTAITGASSTGYGAADFVLGYAANSITPIYPVKGSILEYRDGFFVLDNWQATQKLTLNLGLRYELPTVPSSLNGYTRILNASQTALIPASGATTPGQFKPTPGFKFINPTHNDWAPRIGMAYRATDKTVLRGGFGIYWNANQLNTYTLTTQNYPLSATVNYYTAPTNLLSLTNPTPGAGAAAPVAGVPGTYVNAVTMGPNLPTQELYQWNLSLGQQLWRGAGMEIQYLGSHAIHLDRDFYDNDPMPGPGNVNARRPNQLFGKIRDITNDEYSHYHGLTTILRQRMSHGLSGTASYTWSHSMDLSANSNNGGTTMDQYNINLDYGNSNWDIRNRFVGILTYDLPRLRGSNAVKRAVLGGWQANAIVDLQSGEPFNVYLDFDQANVSIPNNPYQRMNYVHAPRANCSVKNYIEGNNTSCIDGTAYSVPAPYTFGNAHRNDLAGPGLENVDFSVFKDFPITQRARFQIRAEAANVFNHPSAANPNSDVGSANYDPKNPGGGNTGSDFGTVTSTQSTAREIQLAGKIIF